MSEFTYACPVCHQHIKCDATKGGAVMKCPTCFQRIVAPQAPSEGEGQMIFTGHRYVEKKTAALPTNVPAQTAAPTAAGNRKAPLVIGFVLAVVLGVGAAVFFFKNQTPANPTNGNQAAAPSEPVIRTASAPQQGLILPETSDVHWTYDLASVKTPDVPVAGRIRGKPLLLQHVEFVNGQLIFYGPKGNYACGLQLDFNGATAAALAGKTFNITTDTKRAPRVIIYWREPGKKYTENISTYAMRLEFNQVKTDGDKFGPCLLGNIYLCASDNTKSYLMGQFKAYLAYPK